MNTLCEMESFLNNSQSSYIRKTHNRMGGRLIVLLDVSDSRLYLRGIEKPSNGVKMLSSNSCWYASSWLTLWRRPVLERLRDRQITNVQVRH